MSIKSSDFFLLHFIILILGFTAILGKLIDVDAVPLVWYRMFFAFVFLFGYILIKRKSFKTTTKSLFAMLGIGIIVAAHWITFFHAIKISNVSVTLGCLASITLITSFLEPIFFKKKIFWVEVFLGLLIIFGLYLIFQFEFEYFDGIVFALISAFLAGLFTVLNKKLTKTHQASIISFYEMLSGFIIIGFYLLFFNDFKFSSIIDDFRLNFSDLFWLIILGTICTGFAFVKIVHLMKKFSAFIIVLSVNLEPVYGIILALLIFGSAELMSFGFYIGTAVILLSVFFYPLLKKKFRGSN